MALILLMSTGMTSLSSVSSHFLTRNRILPVTFLLAASLVMSLSLLRIGIPYGHDSEEHAERYVLFASQISQGEFYPRWLANFNGGLGSPVMFVYAPLAYYVPAALRPLLHFPIDGARESREFGVSMWIALALSGLTAFWWLTSFVTRISVATLGALLYMAMPYHLSIDLYTRVAVAEVWGFVWMPLILYFAASLIRTRKLSAVIGLATAYALLIFTHLLTTLIFSPVVLAASWFLAEKGRRLSALKYVSMSLALGAGISAAYLLPALLHENYTSPFRLAELRPHLSYETNFMTLRRSWAEPGGRVDFQWKVSWLALSALSVAIGAFTLMKGAWTKKEGQPARLWAAVAVGSTIMMFPSSGFLWRAIPQLAAIQFPYRFNTLLTIATVALLALAADSLKTPLRAWRSIIAAGIAAVIVLWAVSDAKTIRNFTPWRLTSQRPLLAGPLVQDILLGGWSKASDPRYLEQDGMMELSRHATINGSTLKEESLVRIAERDILLTENG